MKKLFIANRGEVATRIITTAKKLGIPTVVAVSEADIHSLAAQMADETAHVGPAPAGSSYLNMESVLEAIKKSGADAVHPGSGFLSESPAFAQAVQELNLKWVGPSADVIELMGNKSAARQAAKEAGVPILPGTDGALGPNQDAKEIAEQIGYPLVVKASSGGGGRGIRLVNGPAELETTIDTARAEAKASFGDERVYLERFVPHARHVEVQLLGDASTFVHLGDRDCSLQRRHQKLVEEATAPNLPAEVRETIRATSVQLASNCGYSGAGTVEFLYDPEKHEAYFIEMNTRLQVEHPITEALTGIDIVAEQLSIADGKGISFTQKEVTFNGHAIEARINAEDPGNNFMPSPGTLTRLSWPSSSDIRIDTGVTENSTVTPFYDSLLAKVIVTGKDRNSTIESMLAALEKVEIEGVKTTTPLLSKLIDSEAFRTVNHYSTFVEDNPKFQEEL